MFGTVSALINSHFIKEQSMASKSEQNHRRNGGVWVLNLVGFLFQFHLSTVTIILKVTEFSAHPPSSFFSIDPYMALITRKEEH